MKSCRPIAAVLAGLLLLSCGLLTGCGKRAEAPLAPVEIEGLTYVETVPLSYANQFSIDRYEGGYSLISVSNGGRYLVVPPDGEVPEGLREDTAVIRQPAASIYLASSAAMDLFVNLDGLDAVRFTSTMEENWYIEDAISAMQNGEILYVGKYSNPDYEMLLSEGCALAVENTMIEHAPETREKLEELGITVFEDFSSYEEHPLGRSEWIKVYGEIIGKAGLAESLFEEQKAYLEQASAGGESGKTVAFFYINTAGQAVTRKPGNYVSKMIELAGGVNAFQSLGDDDSATSSVTVEMEKFYEEAKDADVIIYNSSMSGELATVDELVAQNALLADFKAVQEGNVWCTRYNFYQETTRFGEMIADIHLVLTEPENADALQFLYRLEGS